MIKDLIFLHEKCEIYFYFALFVDDQELEYDTFFIHEILVYFDKKFRGIHPSIRSFNAFSRIIKQYLRFKNDKSYKFYKLE